MRLPRRGDAFAKERASFELKCAQRACQADEHSCQDMHAIGDLKRARVFDANPHGTHSRPGMGTAARRMVF